MKTPAELVPERPPPDGPPPAGLSPRRRWRRWAVALGFAFLALLGGWVVWDFAEPALDCRSHRADAEQALDTEVRSVAADPIFAGSRSQKASSSCTPFDYTTYARVPYAAGERPADEALISALEHNGWAEGPSPVADRRVSPRFTCLQKALPGGSVAEAEVGGPADLTLYIAHWREGGCALP